MFLIFDTKNGIRETNSLTLPNKDIKFVDRSCFYKSLKNLKDGEIIVTVTNESFSKKISKEYKIIKEPIK
jgi:hypothetical protein